MEGNLLLVVEPGYLEWQVEYFLLSLVKFGCLESVEIWVISPRGLPLKESTRRFLQKFGARYVEKNLNPHWGFHPLSNKAFAGKYLEEIGVKGPLLFLDTDILVLNSLRPLLSRPAKIQVKTAHHGEIAAADFTDSFWRPLFELFKIKPNRAWTTIASGEAQPTLPYYNTGVIATEVTNRLFTRWVESYETLRVGLPELYVRLQDYGRWPPYHQKSRLQKQLYHIGQVLFACTVLKYFSKTQIYELSVAWNYPLPKHALLGRAQINRLDKITLLHYHREFRNPLWFTKFEADPALTTWLVETLYGARADT